MNLEGKITIRLKLNDEGVADVAIESRRILHATRVLQGRSLDEAVQMVPCIFTLCATAQASAAAQAGEQAAGRTPGPELAGVRQALVDMESLREHLWRILLDWPGFYGAEPQRESMADVMRLAGAYRGALTGSADPFRPGAEGLQVDAGLAGQLLAQLGARLERSIYDGPVAEWLRLEQVEALEAWAMSRESVAARLVRQLLQNRWAGNGACGIGALPELAPAPLAEAMSRDGFIEQPIWEGACYETGCLPRNDSPLLRALRQRYGNGLLTRILARLTEVARLWQGLVSGVPGADMAQAYAQEQVGIGQVAAARGLLVHRIALRDGQVEDYRILAPTEWNFHPRGVVAQSLFGLRGDASLIERQTRLLINAVDPCVAYELQIEPGVEDA
ncbi:MAG: nickel-dependent hydrogenase large subunit [Candidatus Thiodiazotropha sp.]